MLADGWSYTNWVVGASHIRAVDAGWPAPGARIHYCMGVWPFTVEDATTVVACERPYLLELTARLWPFGAAGIRFDLLETHAHRTEVRMTEHVIEGPARRTPSFAQALILHPRNAESLTRLCEIAERRG
ncbi:SRPBCC family protein [Nocardia callitridis]|uniref:SRPBCC family protein n=1 Tax=Nocardia callitridis TaxID=648753 RepID=UPI0031EDA204